MTELKRLDENTHPSKEIIGSDGSGLSGKKIILCIAGSIAAYKAIDLARLLMRHGAEVVPVTSPSTAIFLNPQILKWATGNEVITKLSADLEHIKLANYHMSDLVLVYPSTANTIGKFLHGIDDTTVTSILTVAFGAKIPIIFAPAMHEAMFNNSIIIDNIKKLKTMGIHFIEPSVNEDKAKIATPESALSRILEIFSNINKPTPLSGKRILITAGGTSEYIDPIRVISNLSSGKMGFFITSEALELGADVTLIVGHNSLQMEKMSHTNLTIKKIVTIDDMERAIYSELSSVNFDMVILNAAVSDFKPLQPSTSKISSTIEELTLKFIPTNKIINQIKKINKNVFLIGFKADIDLTSPDLLEKSFEKLVESNADLIVANDVGKKSTTIGSDYNELFVIDTNKKITHIQFNEKKIVVKELFKIILRYFKT